VSPGSYGENLVVNTGPIHLISTSGFEETVIDGESNGTTVEINESMVINGFAITGGSSGGIGINTGSVTIEDCRIFLNQTAGNGGGIRVNNGSSLSLQSCMVDCNTSGGNGGGVWFGSSYASVCTNCRFDNNSAESGGGICLESCGPAVFQNCHVIGNTASGGSPSFGGGIYNDASYNVTYRNCMIADNSEGLGPAIYMEGLHDMGWQYFINCTVTGNTQAYQWGAIFQKGMNSNFRNCIVAGNDGYDFYLTGQMYYMFAYVEYDWSCLESLGEVYIFQGLGDFDYTDLLLGDPGFTPGLLSDYHLSDSSICVDAGDPDVAMNDTEDTACPGYALWPALGTTRNDMGAYGGPNAGIWNQGGTAIGDETEISSANSSIMNVHPNPVHNDLLYVSAPDNVELPVELSIFDITGRLVMSETLDTSNEGYLIMPIRSLENGIYICRRAGPAESNHVLLQ
jgi:predicted outer membrane repeat protein